jgi:hypothetical protein
MKRNKENIVERNINCNCNVIVASFPSPLLLAFLLPGLPGTGTGAHTAAASLDTSFCSDSYQQ